MRRSAFRRSGAPVLVGRSAELAALVDALGHAPSVVLVEGEAGIGKTRLIREAIGHPSVRGRRILLGTCHPLREPFPYGPVFDLLRQLEPRLERQVGGRSSPVAERLSPVCGALRPYLPELAECLPPAPEPLPDHRAGRHRLFRAVRALLAALGPVVVVVEDLHWADDGTRDLVRFLVDDPPPAMSAVLSYRREELPGGALPLGRAYREPPGTTAVLLPLRPLDVEGVRSLADAISGGAGVSAAFAAELHERTAGIPFVLEEVVRALDGERDGSGGGDGSDRGGDKYRGAEGRLGRGTARETLDALEVPALLRDAMAERMAGLSGRATAVVHAAAVLRVPAGEELIAATAGRASSDIGDSTEPGHAVERRGPSDAGEGRGSGRAGEGTEVPDAWVGGGAAVGGLLGVRDGIREALRAGVLYDCGDDRYGFRHPLAQQAVYGGLAGVDRRRLHERAVAALAGAEPPPLVRLAYHARQAGDLAAWLRYGEAAAGAAREMGDTAVAVEVLEGLLSDQRLGAAERGRLATELSRVAVIGLSFRRAARLLGRIVRDRDLPVAVRGEIRLNLGLLQHNQAGNHEQGRADTEAAVAELRERPALAARGMAALAMPSWGEHPYAVHQRWAERAEELVAGQEVAGQADPALRMAVRGNHLALRAGKGEPGVWADVEEMVCAGRTPAERLQVARLCGNVAEAAAWLGHDDRAEHYRRTGTRLAAECGAPFLQGIIDGTALRLAWHGGRWQGLDGRARQVLDVVQGVSGISADAHLVLGWLAVARGEWEEAAAELGAAALDDPANAPAPILAAASGAMVRVLVARGEPAAACAEAERAVGRVRRKGIWAWGGDLVPMAVIALVRSGRGGEAAALTEEFAGEAAGIDAPLAAAAVEVCRGAVACGRERYEEAVAAFDRARSGYAALSRPYSEARAAEASARCRLAAGDRAAAGAVAELADVYAGLGATRDAARCRRVLRGNGVVTPSRRGRRGYGGELSPREREVARLVALGHTNREIADVLFLSPRTVEQHVAKVLRKLGVASRAEVASRTTDAEGASVDA
ncbi:ATP-binding protein [Streptomyces sclerotialus]|uniref:ATP-binding protein n=1 Tax=Streptomyces sclerotialus TaxID=1957 RepID=UPI000691915A